MIKVQLTTVCVVDVPDKLRAHLNRPQPPALEHVRMFLLTTVADALSMAELRADQVRMAKVNKRTVLRDAEAIEALLADPPPPGTLAALVAFEGNWVLDEYSDAAAAEFLRSLAVLIREAAES